MTTPVTAPRIRRRRAADLDGCVAALAEVHRVDRYPLNWPADPRRWLGEPRPDHAWVAVADTVIVGHVAVQRVVPGPAGAPTARPTAEVARLFVAPSARGSALGSALLDRVRRWANARGTDLVLEVTSDNAAAAALYERTGWRCTGSSTAPWTAPDGGAVSLRHYTLSCAAGPAITVSRRASRAAASRNSGGSTTSTS
ncbi:GNAT family N-acetyltransferase [Micromonospora sp. WMMC250]|uniref:GNAT family N-acetyltransferase n=1 Tax=Micromonospora sp. WMMC250 TaxID=3014781 RepID=UPI0022B6574F|nr:GNAT family N-acetyltransferase [Micromonospora sp. WMMC250]MCZ7373942.1 GNAT family N-acetyltransferase [Micromonospora sp. WMMC250]